MFSTRDWFVLLGLLAATLSGCANASFFGSNSPSTRMECLMQGGAEEACGKLPEYGFGDWGNDWAQGLASTDRSRIDVKRTP